MQLVVLVYKGSYMYLESERVLLSYVLHYVTQGFSNCFPISLPPHKLVKIAGELMGMTTFHPFQFCLHPTPITLHVLSVNTCGWLNGVVDHTVTSNIG